MNAIYSILAWGLALTLVVASSTAVAQSHDNHGAAMPSVAAAIDPRTGAPAHWDTGMMDAMPRTLVLVDRLEAGFSEDADTQTWDIQAWHGGDYRRWWLKTEGEGEQGETPEQAELQLLYGRILSPYWDLLLGVRQDWQPDSRTSAVLGIQGMMPYGIETDANVFLSDQGDLSLRAEFETDWLLTQRWILQPRLELNAASSADPAMGQGAGLNSLEAGLRLRYEIRREFAPYLGWSWERRFGVAPGTDRSHQALVLGIRAWF